MRCLTEEQIQQLADGESSPEAAAHVAGCAACAERLRARALLMDALGRTLNPPAAVPPALGARVEEALARESGRGATRLRDLSAFRLKAEDTGGRERTRRRLAYSGLAVAAATLIGVLVIVPAVRRADTTVSASEILARSASQLAAPATSGVELLEYELVLDGVPRDMMPEAMNGAYRVKQAIDHDVPGRFRFSSFGPGGLMLSSIAQDPRSARRVMQMRVDHQVYRFETTIPAAQATSLPEMQRLHMQASVAMMQASGNQHLQVVDTPDGRQYRIDVPRVATSMPSAVWDLTEAHVVIDASDYHIVEFAVKGAFLKQAYSLSYRLIGRQVQPAASVSPAVFDVPADPDAIVLRGEGSSVPPRDALIVALRELARVEHR
jgi:hypothetical protein